VSLASCLARLEHAIEAASSLGLDTSRAVAVRETTKERLRFPASVYVLALAGGTGVGKSSLLNALAGRRVSRVSARRPTTPDPVAWVPASARADLGPLLEWLGVREVREHDDARASDLAILDLPDLDSIAPEHRARVDELLPRVDAVVWVADLEKYKDAILHDEYVRSWGPRVARQLVVLNKIDRVDDADAERLRADLGARLRDEGLGDVSVALTHALDGAPRIDELRQWIESGVAAKRIVAGRVAAEVVTAVADLAERVGVGGADAAPPLVDPGRREHALGDVARETAGLLDLNGLERQAVAATRLAARPRGGGPLGHFTAWVYRWSGRERAAADPMGHLRRWRERGSLARAAAPLRQLVSDLVASLPPEMRPAVASLGEPSAVEKRLADALDGAALSPGASVRPPTSIVWPAIGFGQYVFTALLLFVALWLASLFFLQTPVASVEVPSLGPVPTPVLALGALLLFGYVLARLLGLHAGWTGRRWAGRLSSGVAIELHRRLHETLFAPLDALDAARLRLDAAARSVRVDCGSVEADGGELRGRSNA
jgi:GTP-binding protein EngB required for normal cell division